DQAEAMKLAKKLKSGKSFDLNDFLSQLAQMKNMGGLQGLMDKLPTQLTKGAGQVDANLAEKQMRRTEAIILSMTLEERSKPDILKASRKRRIAAGAGVQVQEVNRLLNQFDQMRGMMKQMQKGGLAKLMKKMGGMKGMPPGGMPPGGGFKF
ncbi:MAG TPA: signal recognition particle protein, partial [Limnobacter sp.]|nr:signal recognition particle protein [Limnobacter sp.]